MLLCRFYNSNKLVRLVPLGYPGSNYPAAIRQ